MRVRIFLRRPFPGQRSVERIFTALAPHLDAEVRTLPHESQGFGPRLSNLRFARGAAVEVNHVGGDVQYLVLGLPRHGSVLTVLDLVNLRRLRGWRRTVLKLIWYTIPIRRAGIVTTISDAVRAELEAEIPAARGKTRTIPVPLLPGFTPNPRPMGPRPLVFMQGSTPHKNVARQAEALKGLPVDALYVGTPNAEAAEALAAIGARIESGLDDEAMVARYRECDLLLFASLYEGYGMPIVEAQAIGRPVVTSDRGAMREVAGGAAILVDPESVESIRSGVRRAIEDRAERERLVAAGFVNAERTTVERVAALYRAAYVDAAGSRR